MESQEVFEMPAELTATGNIPSPPGVVMEILRLVADEESTVEDLAAVIEVDPALAAKLLGTVNSGLYTLNRQIHSLDQAAVLVGFRAIRTLALSASLADGVDGRPDCEGFDLELYWRHSLMTAVLGRRLASHVKRALCEDVFSVGLVGNIGRLVVARCVPQRYAVALTEGPWSHCEVEQRVLGYTTSQVSAALLKQWGLPDSLCIAVRHIEQPSAIDASWDANTIQTTALVAAADLAADHLLETGDDRAGHDVAADLASSLGIGLRDAHESLHEAGEQIGDVHHLIANSLPDGISPAELIGQAQSLLEGASA